MTVRQTTRVPKHLHAWLADRAKANHRSLNAELISILSIEAATGVIVPRELLERATNFGEAREMVRAIDELRAPLAQSRGETK